jgi:hypothetical protein
MRYKRIAYDVIVDIMIEAKSKEKINHSKLPAKVFIR